MAQSNSNIFGDFTGKLGNLVIYKLNGKTVARTKPRPKKDKPTVAQQEARNDFKHVMKLVQTLKPLVHIGFRDVSEGQLMFHTALSVNLKAYRQAGKPAGLDWLKLSKGMRAGAADLNVMPITENSFEINWGKATDEQNYADHDRVYAVAVFADREQVYYTYSRNAQRSNRSVTLEIQPVSTGTEIHFFVFFMDTEGSLQKKTPVNISDSQWAGSLIYAQ